MIAGKTYSNPLSNEWFYTIPTFPFLLVSYSSLVVSYSFLGVPCYSKRVALFIFSGGAKLTKEELLRQREETQKQVRIMTQRQKLERQVRTDD